MTSGPEASFSAAVAPHRDELRVHCYRMTGRLDESEDLLQETLLRAWRAWPRFRGEASVRTWLYRIATNVCLSALERGGRRPEATWPYPEPFPDSLPAAADGQPEARLEGRETIELTFLAGLQVLTPRQRAAFVLRDVLGLPAADAATSLGISVAATKSALQRARAALREALSADRMRWPAERATPEEERDIAGRYVAAVEERDAAAMARLLHEDVRVRYLPRGLEVEGSADFIDGSTRYAPAGDFLYRETVANGQPAIGVYLRRPGDHEHRRLSLAVLRIAGGKIVEIVDFSDPQLLDAFGLPATAAR